MYRMLSCLTLVLTLAVFNANAEDPKRPLTLPDIMKFREIKSVEISDNGEWLVYIQQPDRGDKSAHIVSLRDNKSIDVALGNKVSLTNDGSWASMLVGVPLLQSEKTGDDADKEQKPGGLLVESATGKKLNYNRVKNIGFSGDNRYALVHFYPSEKTEAGSSDEVEENAEKPSKSAESANEQPGENTQDQGEEVPHHLKEDMLGTPALLVNLDSGEEVKIDHVQHYQFAEDGPGLAYVIADEDGVNNALVFVDTQTGQQITLDQTVLGTYPHVAFSQSGEQLAFIRGNYQHEEHSRAHQLFTYAYAKKSAKKVTVDRSGWFISHDNNLVWSKDEKRLFFGEKPTALAPQTIDTDIVEEADLFDLDKIKANHSLLVWHGDDPRIKPHEIKEYEDEQKRFYVSVYHIGRKRYVPLTDERTPDAEITDNGKAIVVKSDIPYRKEMTWDGAYSDFYHVDLSKGKTTLIERRMSSSTDALVSPSGRYVCYYRDGAIWLFDAKKKRKTNVSASITTPFANERHDYPSAPPGYGIAGWLEDDKGVLVYDRFDIWKFTTAGKAENLTRGVGRERRVEYRIVETDPEQSFFSDDARLLLKAYHDDLKYFGFYGLELSNPDAPTKLLEDKKKYEFVAKAKHTDTLLFTVEDMGEFPDLWKTTNGFSSYDKVTDVNPQIDQFLWGEPMLVEWRSTKGKPLQGVLIKPANYQPGQRYPVVVYYYRYFSQRLYEFNPMKVNHRPNFPYYTSNGYAVFLPDVKFDVGTPGPSATDALVPGIQKLVDIGIADENAIGLHGHSWSGYQTAYVITQTDVFKAAVAGAPVSNMTSAYSGIRLGSGLARQFQYEKSQSRIGASIFDDLPLYIENSPVFYANRINTPLLIQFGDVDDAVPWQQGIEMYLAMRRLNKPVIMLQYQGEPHHLKKYANKVDYTQKMKAFFDHHLKGEPAPKWMVEGIPYSDPKKD